MKRAANYFIKTALIFAIAFPLYAFETSARNAYVIDVSTNTTLFEKDSERPMPPASTSKLMTIALLFKALKDGEVNLETKFKVSERARNMEGSRMFLELGEMVRVEDLIRGILVQSGNDACVTVAEGLLGSEDKFVKRMNEYAAELGLQNSSFGNASGMPTPKQLMSAKDLARLAYFLFTTYPDYWHYFAEPEFTYNGITQANRNPLIGTVAGADGLKTGHTDEAGYSLVGSIERDGRHVIFVIMGLESEAARATEASRVADWAFSQFKVVTQFKAGEPITTAKTWLGAVDEVSLTVQDDVVNLVSNETKAPRAKARFNEPLSAPLTAGDVVGELIIEQENMPSKSVPLIVSEDVEKANFSKRAIDVVTKLASGIME